eukprot:COSAG02_NODE_7087_length_3191_cov_6.196657_1_plen_209_part_00
MPNVSVVPSALSIPRDAPLRNPTRCHVRSGFLDSTEVELQEDMWGPKPRVWVPTGVAAGGVAAAKIADFVRGALAPRGGAAAGGGAGAEGATSGKLGESGKSGKSPIKRKRPRMSIPVRSVRRRPVAVARPELDLADELCAVASAEATIAGIQADVDEQLRDEQVDYEMRAYAKCPTQGECYGQFVYDCTFCYDRWQSGEQCYHTKCI